MNTNVQIGRTEQIKNTHNPEFAQKFRLEYYFEQAQYLRFEIYDIDSTASKLKEHVCLRVL
jgi:hypothetical protein